VNKRSWAFALSCLVAVTHYTASAETPHGSQLAGPVRPCGACRVAPQGTPAESASVPGLAPRASSAPEPLAGPVRPCGACRLTGPRGTGTPPPPEA
jgi:hypothetical protein